MARLELFTGVLPPALLTLPSDPHIRTFVIIDNSVANSRDNRSLASLFSCWAIACARCSADSRPPCCRIGSITKPAADCVTDKFTATAD
jgi:hypothetical protein